METKHTKEYAECLANGIIPKNPKEAFVEGYMDAIKKTSAPELLEALIKICNDAKIMSLGENGNTVKVMVDSINQGINAIKKATE